MSFLLFILLSCGRDPADEKPWETDDSGDPATPCSTTFTYTPATGDLDGVFLAGTFNDWDPGATPMEEVSPGTYAVTLELEPGAWPYKFVEFAEWTYGGYEGWTCDPEADLIHCDEGYKDPSDTNWNHACTASANTACNSMVVVEDCTAPKVELLSLSIDREGGEVVAVAAATGEGELEWRATLDGEEIGGTLADERLTVAFDGLPASRHTLRIAATAADGRSDEAYVPFWLDVTDPRDEGWRRGIVYFAFLDRVANGESANDGSEGAVTSAGENELGDYMGGDLAGLLALLPYLDDLGVTTIWISNLQENAEGAWSGDCEATYAGYHAYWPDEARAVEAHFGDAQALRDLVDAAHARNMRVVMDWVANHVHEDHPYAGFDGWFNDYLPCKVGDDYSNFDEYPETCWFADYLPDVDYTNPEPLDVMVGDALWWARTFELDGFRVDAAKHMTHAVVWNLEARVRDEIEHRGVGGDEEFWTVGETFDGYDRIAAYLSRDNGDGTEKLQLDGQFDFPMYYAVLGAFATETGSLADLENAIAAAESAYGTALMSNFLGNHDVVRFSTIASEGGGDSCWSETDLVSATFPSDDRVYDRLRLAWSFLLTQPAPPLVYYGDEIGMPGYTDPDNRQPLFGYVDPADVGSVEDMAAQVGPGSAAVVRHLGALGRARRAHPAFWRGAQVEWWKEPTDWPTLWAYARVDSESDDAILVVLNRSGDDRTLTNGLAFAGLPEGTWTDVLTGDTFTASGDSITVMVGAYESRVLVAGD